MERRCFFQKYHNLDKESLYRVHQRIFYFDFYNDSGFDFHHPFPYGNLERLDSSTEHITKPLGRFLCARTQQARLLGDKQREPVPEELERTKKPSHLYAMFLKLPPVLRDDTGEEVGEIRPHSKDDNNLIKSWRDEKGDGENTIGFPYDIVAIFRGYYFSEPVPPPEDYYTFYNVLWVTWITGVAYRRGVGRVKRGTGESMEKEDVELILG